MFRFRFSLKVFLEIDLSTAFPNGRRIWELLDGASTLIGLIANLLTILSAICRG